MYTKRFKTTNLGKQDIREIPFEELAVQCQSLAKVAVQDAEDKLQATATYNRDRLISTMYNAVASSLESTEGVEENIRQSVDSVKTELPPDKLKEIKQNAYKQACIAFCEKYTLKARASWLPAQLVSLVGKWTPEHAEEGSGFCARTTLDAVLGSGDMWLRGCYFFMMYAKRGDFIDTQYKEPSSHYCALVPLILSGFLKYHKVSYDRWNKKDLHLIIEPNLYEAITCTIPEGLTSAELLSIREAGMLIRSGKAAGTSRNPLTTFKLWGVADSMIGDLPWLAQVMLTQIWCAHPSARNSNMILDPSNWTNTPEPLISTYMFKEEPTPAAKPTKYTRAAFAGDIPWDDV